MVKRIKSREKGNILVAEKDPALRAFVRHTLTGQGYAVFEAEDGHQAFLLSETLTHPVHLLLADVVLDRQLNGVELSRHLRILRPGLRVLFLSGVPANPALRQELQFRLDSYLSKPFTAEGLVKKVQVLLESGEAPKRRPPPVVERGVAGYGAMRIFPHGKAGNPDWRPVALLPDGPVFRPDQ